MDFATPRSHPRSRPQKQQQQQQQQQPQSQSRPHPRPRNLDTNQATHATQSPSWNSNPPPSIPAQSPSQYRTPQPSSLSNNLNNPASLHERVTAQPVVRSRSPDVSSRVSTSSSAAIGAPQLRKKPKSNAIKHKRRSLSSEVATPVASSTNTQEEYSDINLASNTADSGRPLARSDSTHARPHSPIYKRPPASHSSYGVETTCGPPPSYTTQRTFSQERIKKVDRNTILWSPNQDKQLESLQNSIEAETALASQTQDSSRSVYQSTPDTTDPYSLSASTEMDPMANITVRGVRALSGEVEEDSKGSSSDERRSEDLFLNIAKVDAGRPSLTKAEKRRSRISIPFLSNNRPVYETKSSPIHPPHDSELRASQREEPRYYSKRSSIGPHMPGVLSRNNLNEANRLREHSVEPSSDVERTDRPTGRRSSIVNGEPAQLSQRPSQGLRGQRLVQEIGYTNPSRLGEHNATESTVSTTAPSTVWDELDDLKSRIRKLELTGKLPPSSAAAMSSAERPRTATTAATTMSVSPKIKTASTSLPSAIDGIPSSVHPLLHEALGTAKQVVSQEVYTKLYATASDALQLAIMMNAETAAIGRPQSPSHDRQIRRRTESMCRGLTELAIALTAEAKGVPATVRPGSRDQSHPPSAMLRSRRYSNDPGDRPVQSRVTSRLDNRRASLVFSPMSPESGVTDSTLPPLPGLRLGRASTVTRSRRGPSALDGGDDEYDASPSVRPVSRAMTELSAYRRAPRDSIEASREITHHNAMPYNEANGPVSTPLPHHITTSFVSRRKQAPTSSYTNGHVYESSPITPAETSSIRNGWPKGSAQLGEHTPTDVASEIGRTSSGRRIPGFASRIGSSVGSRLRAVRADRDDHDSFHEMRD